MLRTRRWLLTTAVVLAVWGCCAAEVNAQLFGSRSLGSPLSRRPSAGVDQQENVGTLEGSERFIRGNRSLRDFVGRDTRDPPGFVGAEQASARSGAIAPAAPPTEPRSAVTPLNTPLAAAPANRMHHPRLTPSFQTPAPNPASVAAPRLRDQLLKSLNRHAGHSAIEVSVAARTATLRGEVASARDRELAELLVLFEPGISAVRNQLKVVDSQAAPEQLPQPGSAPE